MTESPSTTHFLESASTGEQGHNAGWITSDMDHVIQKHKNTIFSGGVTDNTAVSKKIWAILKQNVWHHSFRDAHHIVST